MENFSLEEFEETLRDKIKILNETIWEYQITTNCVNQWLGNFKNSPENSSLTIKERLHALYLLQYFMYFGDRQIRELLKCLFRDLYKYPIIEQIRKENGDTTKIDFINKQFIEARNKTRFLGLGNPSESGCHLLYYFRQENCLPKDLFIQTYQIFQHYGNPSKISVRDNNVTRYIFIDDICGSGQQALNQST